MLIKMASAEASSAVQILFKENSREDFLSASELLLRLANNVIENPHDAKYRRIRVANPLLESKLLPFVGGMECLFEMGFQEDGEFLTLPVGCSMSVVKQVRDEITGLRSSVAAAGDGGNPSAAAASSIEAVVRSSPPSRTAAQAEGRPPAAADPPNVPTQAQCMQTIEDIQRKEAAFWERIKSSLSHVMQYEARNLQQQALQVIPVDELTERAKARLESPPRNLPGADLRDCLLLELLDWFKNSFFHWVDSRPCESCGGITHHAGSAVPTAEDLSWGGSRVETHRCDSCGSLTRFPRYNHPGKLLETRRGRCGEWANAFTLCCRALGFEARYVLDWTDHVWTEVFSVSQRRWLHCDPCENVCDRPLLYEKGWGKKLTYVLAFSKDEIQDVTWRYSAKHKDVLARRAECREHWLVRTIHIFFERQLRGMSAARKEEMLQRLVVETVEFLTPKTDNNAARLSGRTTGSEAWRRARGELGSAPSDTLPQYSFRLLQEERHSEVLHVMYSCAKDTYVRVSSHDIATSRWQACARGLGVFRKEERDWKKAYLAREEGEDRGEISWKVDLTEEDLRINKLELKACSAVFESGAIDWRICCGDKCFSVPGSQLNELKTFDLDGGKVLEITAVLTGGNGDVAWQHAQLFRQNVDDSDYPFELILHLG